MKHKRKKKTLGRDKAARTALYKNLCSSLINEGFVVTTETKGKQLKSVFEKLVTKARREMTLAKRRELLERLGDKRDLAELVEIAQAHKERPGGYTRITKMPDAVGNGARMVKIEIIT